MPRITGIYDHYGWWGLEINLQRRWSPWTKTMGQWACDQPKLPFYCSCWTTQMMTCPSNIEDFISASKTWILFGLNTQFRWFGFGLGSQSPNFNDTQLRGEHQAHQTNKWMLVCGPQKLRAPTVLHRPADCLNQAAFPSRSLGDFGRSW